MLRLPEQMRDDLLKYLETRPYREVAGGIMSLMGLETIEEKTDDTKGNNTTK